MFDVVVIGAGPSGLAAAAAFAQKGLAVRCIDSVAGAPWYPNFGIWAEDAARAAVVELDMPLWSTATFVSPKGAVSQLPRPYAMLDKTAMQRRLLGQLGVGGLLSARVRELRETDSGVDVELDDGSCLKARLVIDAGGSSSRFTRYEAPVATAAQTAYGIEVRVLAGLDPKQLTLMDWSHSFDDGGPPGFLYVVPRGGDRVFVEETVLAADPPFPIERLRERLAARLAATGVQYERIDAHEERCSIIMGSPLPIRTGRIVAFGAAAGLVHPASGYLVGHTLPIAAPLAEAVAAALSKGDDPGAAAWRTVWPNERVNAWRLYQFGLGVLLRLDQQELGSFFQTFFQLPQALWSSYLSASGGGAQVAEVMTAFFVAAPFKLKLRLVRAGLGRDGIRLAGALQI